MNKLQTKISAPFFNLKTILDFSSQLVSKFNTNNFSIDDILEISGFTKTSSSFDRLISTLKLYKIVTKDNKFNCYQLSPEAIIYSFSKQMNGRMDVISNIFRNPEMNRILLKTVGINTPIKDNLIKYLMENYGYSMRSAKEIVAPFMDSLEFVNQNTRILSEKKSILMRPISEVIETYGELKEKFEEQQLALKESNNLRDSFTELAKEFNERVERAATNAKTETCEQPTLEPSGLIIQKELGQINFNISLSKKLPDISIDDLSLLQAEISAIKDRVDYMLWEKSQ